MRQPASISPYPRGAVHPAMRLQPRLRRRVCAHVRAMADEDLYDLLMDLDERVCCEVLEAAGINSPVHIPCGGAHWPHEWCPAPPPRPWRQPHLVNEV